MNQAYSASDRRSSVFCFRLALRGSGSDLPSLVPEVPRCDGVPGGVGGLVAPRAGLGELGRAIGGPEAVGGEVRVGGYWYSKPPVAANSFVPKLAFVT